MRLLTTKVMTVECDCGCQQFVTTVRIGDAEATLVSDTEEQARQTHERCLVSVREVLEATPGIEYMGKAEPGVAG